MQISRAVGWRTPTVVLICGGLIPMTLDLGCGRAVFSFAIALQNLVWGLGMPVAGAIFDATGSYLLVWLAAIALSVIAAALCAPIAERVIARPAMRAAA